MKFRVTWRINGEVTYILENLSAEMAWDESITAEALDASPHNRWHVYMRKPSIQKMGYLAVGEEFSVAYQDPSPVGADQEDIRIERIV
jgi:hypothetical protein